MLLGCIADDLTGATDLSLMLSRQGMRTIQTTGVPVLPMDLSDVDAVVVALKSRSNPAHEAVSQSLAAADWLLAHGAVRLFFKYCSTFDSTSEGNIGPVTEALLARLGENFTIACPAFPATGRSIYMGNLFVNGVPLAESPMRDHPLNPMRDSDLRRVLRRQTRCEVGHVPFTDVDAGASAIIKSFERQRAAPHPIAIVDAISDAHLFEIGRAAVDLRLITGGSGVAIGLPSAYVKAGLLERLHPAPSVIQAPPGRAVILAGSCSAATRGQVKAAIEAGFPHYRIDPMKIAAPEQAVLDALDWLKAQDPSAIPLIYSSDDPENVGQVQQQLGRDVAGHLSEGVMADIAKALPQIGFSRILVAGGETSGAVIHALGIKTLSIGPEIDPGVPWTLSHSGPDLVIALKSGNFGTVDFFLKAWDLLQ